MFNKYSIRELNNAFDNTESQIMEQVTFDSSNGPVNLPLGPLKLFVFLRRLRQTDDQIKKLYTSALRFDENDFLQYAGGYYLQAKHSFVRDNFYIVTQDNYYRHIIINGIRPDGSANLSEARYIGAVSNNNSEEVLWDYLIGLIAK